MRVRRAEFDEASAPKALQLVALAKELADPLHSLREHGDERLPFEEPRGVFLASTDRTDPIADAADERKVEDRVLREPAHLAMVGMLVVQGQAQHHSVYRERSRVVRDEEAAPFLGDALDAMRDHAENTSCRESRRRGEASARRPGRSRIRRPPPSDCAVRVGPTGADRSSSTEAREPYPTPLPVREPVRGGSRSARAGGTGDGRPVASRVRVRASIIRSSRSSSWRMRLARFGSPGNPSPRTEGERSTAATGARPGMLAARRARARLRRCRLAPSRCVRSVPPSLVEGAGASDRRFSFLSVMRGSPKEA